MLTSLKVICIGFDWSRLGDMFREAAKSAGRSLQQRISVGPARFPPQRGAVGCLLPPHCQPIPGHNCVSVDLAGLNRPDAVQVVKRAMVQLVECAIRDCLTCASETS
ncbi:MAG: hypothetical protein V1790_08220 [Planctomycetota bacterium]